MQNVKETVSLAGFVYSVQCGILLAKLSKSLIES